MSRSLSLFRHFTGLDLGKSQVKLERSSVCIARGTFSNFHVDGPQGPFHWSPNMQSIQVTPFVDSEFNAYPPPDIRGVPTLINIDADIMSSAADGTAVVGWRFHISAENIPAAADFATGTVHMEGNFGYPPNIAHAREGLQNFAWRLTAHKFPVLLYFFAVRIVGGTARIIPYEKGDGARFELFAPQFDDSNSIFSNAQAITLQNDVMLPDLLPLLREQPGADPDVIAAAEMGDLNALHLLASGQSQGG